MKTILLLLCTVQLATAQVASGSFHGRVTDETGGVVAKTSIVARQESTGFSRSVLSDDSGTYRIDGLAPGTYSISAERKGFRPVTATHARLEVNQYAKLDFELKVGTTSEIINVVYADVSARDRQQYRRLSGRLGNDVGSSARSKKRYVAGHSGSRRHPPSARRFRS